MKKTLSSILMSTLIGTYIGTASAGELYDKAKQYFKDGKVQGEMIERSVILVDKINIMREVYTLPNGMEIRLGYPLLMLERGDYLKMYYHKFPSIYNFIDGENNEMYKEIDMPDGLNGNEEFDERTSKKTRRTTL